MNSVFMLPHDIANMKLPDPDLRDYYEFEKARIFFIDEEITVSMHYLTKAIMKFNYEDKDLPIEDRKPIKLFIDSPGGDLDVTLSLINVIKMSKTPIWTINLCACFSGAALMLMAGHKRFAVKNTKALIHSGSGYVGGTFEAAEAHMDNYKSSVEDMRNFILENTKIDAKMLKKKQDKEWYLGVQDMIDYGVIDEEVVDLDVFF